MPEEGQVRGGLRSYHWICEYRGQHDLDKNRASGEAAGRQPAVDEKRRK